MAASDRTGDEILKQISDQVHRVLSDDIYWFPVRHHSPAAAKHIKEIIQQRRPKVVFIEAPSECNDLVSFVVDAKTKPPIALYSSYRDDDNVLGLAGIASPAEDVPARFATWYPLLQYSPEYVAMVTAEKTGAEVVFIDLPHYGLVKPRQDHGESEGEPSDEAGESPKAFEDDRLLFESGFYQSLAEAAGFKCWDEAWDSLFEFGDYNESPERFRRELATFCAAARATSLPGRIESDGTIERERFMWRTIETTLADRGLSRDQAVVICGGFHLFLDRDDQQPTAPLPDGTVYTSVVPYSFFQVSELSGYGAGNRAPRFFQTAWEMGRGTDEALLSNHVVTTLKLARREGHAVSSADAISVCQHANMLSALRGRGRPVLDDIHDAIMTCCCKGDPGEDGFYLRRAMDQADIGTKIGTVTDALGRLPLVTDFYTLLESHRFADVAGQEKQIKVTLDTRDETDQQRSAFLHRLRFMKVPVCEFVSSGSGLTSGTLFKEVWKLKWSPKVDAALIEQNIYGDRIESAALAMLREEVSGDESHAGRTCGRLRQAMEMRLPMMIRELSDLCQSSIEADTRFVSLAEAAMHLNVLRGHADLSGVAGGDGNIETRRDTIARLLIQCFQRACFALPESSNLPGDQHAALVNALRTLGELVLRDEESFDRDLFVQYVDIAAGASNDVYLQGAFMGVLAELRAITPEEIADRVSGFIEQPTERMVLAGAYLDGVLSVSRTSILLGADHLVQAVDKLIASARWEDFLTMLPQLRAAFERLHQRQRDSIAQRVARLHGLVEAEELTELTTSVGAAAMFARIDAEVAKIMESWDL